MYDVYFVISKKCLKKGEAIFPIYIWGRRLTNFVTIYIIKVAIAAFKSLILQAYVFALRHNPRPAQLFPSE